MKITPLDAVDGLGVLFDQLAVVSRGHGHNLAGRKIKALDADRLAGARAASEQSVDRMSGSDLVLRPVRTLGMRIAPVGPITTRRA
jgi:hypothetical protein